MLKRELHKIFIKRGLVFFVLLALMAEAAVIFSGVSEELPTKADRELYFSLLDRFKGELTGEKQTEIQTEKKLYEDAPGAVDDIETYSCYLAGRTGGARFFEDADYAIERGTPIINGLMWRSLYPKTRPDLILAAVMLVFVILAETAENETNVTMLKSTSSLGRKRLYRLDVVIALALALVLSLIACAFRLAAVGCVFGFSDGNTPLPALSMFENSTLSNLTLVRGFALVSLLAALGLCGYAALVFIIGRLTGSALTTALVSVLALILPPYIFKAPVLYYFSPISLMQSTGFLIGDVVLEGAEYGGRIVLSAAAGKGSLVFSIIFAFLLIAAALIIQKRRTNA